MNIKIVVKEYLPRGERRHIDLLNCYIKEYYKDKNVDVINVINKYITFRNWTYERKVNLVKRLNTERLIIESLYVN